MPIENQLYLKAKTAFDNEKWEDAITGFKQLCDMRNKIPTQLRIDEDHRALIEYHTNLGNAYSETASNEEASKQFKIAMEMFSSISQPDEKDEKHQAKIFLFMGLIYLSGNKHRIADKCIKNALDIFQKVKHILDDDDQELLKSFCMICGLIEITKDIGRKLGSKVKIPDFSNYLAQTHALLSEIKDDSIADAMKVDHPFMDESSNTDKMQLETHDSSRTENKDSTKRKKLTFCEDEQNSKLVKHSIFNKTSHAEHKYLRRSERLQDKNNSTYRM